MNLKSAVAVAATFTVQTTLATWPEVSYRSAYKEDFPEIAALFGPEKGQYSGYEWSAYTTTTEDGWELSFFRIVAEATRFSPRMEITKKNQSVVFMPGQSQDAETWLYGYFVGTPLPLQLVDEGYQVYIASNRGTKYGATNLNVADSSSEEYWNFDFTDMGLYDLPAIIHSIKQIDDRRVRYVGYAEGNMQMFYGLTQLEDFYFKSQVATFIAMAPCVLPSQRSESFNVPYAEGVGAYRDLGIYAVNGPNWAVDLQTICETLSNDACLEAQRLAETGVPISVKNLEYQKQLEETQRYQVYASSEDYATNSTQPLIEARTRQTYQPVTIESDAVETESEDAGTETTEAATDQEDQTNEESSEPTETVEDTEEVVEPVTDVSTSEIEVEDGNQTTSVNGTDDGNSTATTNSTATNETVIEEVPTFVDGDIALTAISSIPTFLLAADGDLVCSQSQVEWIKTQMEEVTQLRIYQNAGHDFFTWSNQAAFKENILDNLNNQESGAFSALSTTFALLTVSLLAAFL